MTNFHNAIFYRSLPKSEGVDALILVYDVYKETKYFANAFLVALSLESIEVFFLLCSSPFIPCGIVELFLFPFFTLEDASVRLVSEILLPNNLYCALAASKRSV